MGMFTSRLCVLLGVLGVALPLRAIDLNREIVLTPLTGLATEDREIARWQEQAGRAPATAVAFERLGWAFVAKARRTLDAGFYKLAEKTADVIDAQFGAGSGSRLLRGYVLHNLHRFRDAETVARTLVAERGAPADFALLSDALMEQGKMDEAIAALERLMAIKPGLEAFSRVAHVRWLKGDLDGAIAAMESARSASDVRSGETHAWVLMRLSGYYLQRGEGERALMLADVALQCAADYAPGLLARGRALLAQNRAGDALVALERAASINPLPEYQWWLADTQRLVGRESDAEHVEAMLIKRGAAEDPRTMALFLATRGRDASFALRLAREELNVRSDALTRDAFAWALVANGELEAAADAMQRALADNIQDARLLLHAAAIAQTRGDAAAANEFRARARRAAGTLTPSERAMLTPPARSVEASTQIFSPTPTTKS
jgi:tetratricopeptide (TPR) repeat protein